MTAVLLAALLAAAGPGDAVRLPVPLVRQEPERCGPASLVMVLRHYGAGPAVVEAAERAYDPVLRGALVTELARVAREAGYAAEVTTLGADSLVALLREGVPPIVLLHRGLGPVARAHYGVVVGWEPARRRFVLHDGGARARTVSRDQLVRRWRGADCRALIVRRPP